MERMAHAAKFEMSKLTLAHLLRVTDNGCLSENVRIRSHNGHIVANGVNGQCNITTSPSIAGHY